MIGPLTFTGAVFIAGALRPGYNHLTQYVSALGEQGDISAYIMNFGGFFLLGGIAPRILFRIVQEH
jgi:hypothetical membrane protein